MIFLKKIFFIFFLLVFYQVLLFGITIKSLSQVLKEDTNIEYIKCFNTLEYKFPCFLEKKYPNEGIFDKCFTLKIKNGIAQGLNGYVFLNDSYIKEMVWANRLDFLESKVKDVEPFFFSGSMAVISQFANNSYSHFMHEVLGRLAILEMNNIEYDWLYVPFYKKFVKEFFDLWEIDEDKIISPINENFLAQADILVLPSLVINTNVGFNHVGLHPHPYTIHYVREKLLKKALTKDVDISKFSKKVFISRDDSSGRQICNENEIFDLLKEKGFKKFELSKMSVVEQILLFYQAEIVIGEHGTGLTNILFCKKNTIVIELFQELIDSSFWWLANCLNLNYIPLNLLENDTSWAADVKNNFSYLIRAWSAQTVVPLDKIKKIIEFIE